MATVHRRRSSKEEDENLVIASNGLLESDVEEKGSRGEFSAKDRNVSSPFAPHPSPSSPQPTSAGPFRTSFKLPQTNGYSSTLRPTFSTPAHLHIHGGPNSRTRSISSGPFTPSSPSPLSMSFPSQDAHSSASNAVPFPSSATLPEFPQGRRAHVHARTNSYTQLSVNGSEQPPSPSTSTHPRRHSRLHSRNLSIFFPRPGSLPHSAIAEDGAQEIIIESRNDASATNGVPMPSASPTLSRPSKKLGEGFTFGGRPPPPTHDENGLVDEQPPLARASRRGHHHKHSLSHNFFSFLEPGSTSFGDLTSQPTPIPVSQWASTSSSSLQPSGPSTVAFPRDSPSPVSPRSESSTSPFFDMRRDPLPMDAITASLGQFALGAWLWVTGQSVGSLASTGLGYWVVFDAIGVAVSKVLPTYLRRPTPNASIRRPFGCVVWVV